MGVLPLPLWTGAPARGVFVAPTSVFLMFYPPSGELWGFTYSLGEGNRESLACRLV